MIVLALALTLLSVELFISVNLVGHAKALYIVVSDVAGVLRCAEVSDDVKEKAARSASYKMFREIVLICAKLLLITIVVMAVYWIAATRFSWGHLEFWQFLSSWKIMLGLTVLAFGYVHIRNAVKSRS